MEITHTLKDKRDLYKKYLSVTIKGSHSALISHCRHALYTDVC